MEYEIVGSDSNQTKRKKIYQKKIVVVVIGILSAVMILDMIRVIRNNYSLFIYDDVKYDNAIITIRNTRDTKNWNIPSTYKGRTVTCAYLSQSKSESIYIGDKLEDLHMNGFSNLKCIEIPDNLTQVVLENCPVLSEVHIKGSLRYLELTDCPALEDLIIDSDVNINTLKCDNITTNNIRMNQGEVLTVSNSNIKYLTIENLSYLYIKDSTFETIEIIGDLNDFSIDDVSSDTKFLIDKDTKIEAVLIENGYSYQYRE